jgi:ligand-binding SRPBCC domain-containing protein
MSEYRHEASSVLGAPAEKVWAHATSIAGINAELAPLLKMTAPPGLASLEDVDFVPGRPIARSTLLLFGFLPVDQMDVTLVELDPGRRFVERSPVRSQRLWQHEREVVPEGAGCRLTDRLTFEPKLGGPFVAAFLRRVFASRHAYLRRTFG